MSGSNFYGLNRSDRQNHMHVKRSNFAGQELVLAVRKAGMEPIEIVSECVNGANGMRYGILENWIISRI